jgi:hypothetical protein
MRTIVANIAAAQALVGSTMPPAEEILVLDNGFSQKARYLYDGASSAADGNAGQLIIVPSGSVGRFVRADPLVDLVLPATSATTDATVLSLIPAGVTLMPLYGGVVNEVLVAWAGGAGSTIGLSMIIGTAPALPRTKGNLAGVAGQPNSVRSHHQRFYVGLEPFPRGVHELPDDDHPGYAAQR